MKMTNEELIDQRDTEVHPNRLGRARRQLAARLQRAELLVDGIQELFDTWHEDTPSVQDIERMEWSNDLGGIELLEELQRKGGLNPEQKARLDVVLQLLQEALPLLEKIGLRLPEFPRGDHG